MTYEFFETTDLDLSAFIEAKTGRQPSVFRDLASKHATFHFRNDSDIRALILSYSTGSVTVNAKRAFAARRRLFHEVRRVTGGCG